MKYVCLLRAVNVSGKRKIVMKEFCKQLSDQGLEQVSYYLQSGNILFHSDSDKQTILDVIDQVIKQHWQLDDVELFLYDRINMKAAYEQMPDSFLTYSPDALHFTFLHTAPDTENFQAVSATQSAFDPDLFALSEKLVYIHCPNGYGRTRINNGYFEKKLNVKATTRNHKTMIALLERLEAM